MHSLRQHTEFLDVKTYAGKTYVVSDAEIKIGDVFYASGRVHRCVGSTKNLIDGVPLDGSTPISRRGYDIFSISSCRKIIEAKYEPSLVHGEDGFIYVACEPDHPTIQPGDKVITPDNKVGVVKARSGTNALINSLSTGESIDNVSVTECRRLESVVGPEILSKFSLTAELVGYDVLDCPLCEKSCKPVGINIDGCVYYESHLCQTMSEPQPTKRMFTIDSNGDVECMEVC